MTKRFTDEELARLPEKQRMNILRMRKYYNTGNNRNENKIKSSKRYYKKGYEERLQKQKQLKEECFSHYCNGTIQCKQCGIIDIRVLVLDHVNGNGNKERKQYTNGEGGIPFYFYLRKNKYPSGYQVLCLNCNHLEAIKKGFHSERKRNERRNESPCTTRALSSRLAHTTSYQD